MQHVTQIASTFDGKYLAHCQTCGWRHSEWGPLHVAQQFCDLHEKDARELRLNSGARPTTASLIRQYKMNAANTTFEPREREMWATLALELEKAQRKNQPSDGQLALPLD